MNAEDKKAVIIMGSRKDLNHADEILKILKEFNIETELRIASAHKTPERVLNIIRQNSSGNTVFITIAGRSNALSGFIDANTVKPVIAAPPYSDKFGGADIFSSLRMPSGVAPLVIHGAGQAGLAAVKILSLGNEEMEKKVEEYQKRLREKIEEDDREVSGG